jgi:hypothetical protein
MKPKDLDLSPYPIYIPGTPKQWRRIANAYKITRDKRSKSQLQTTSSGLCFAFRCTSKNYDIREAYEFYIISTSWNFNGKFSRGMWFNHDRAGDLLRAKAASLIAKELERREYDNNNRTKVCGAIDSQS